MLEALRPLFSGNARHGGLKEAGGQPGMTRDLRRWRKLGCQFIGMHPTEPSALSPVYRSYTARPFTAGRRERQRMPAQDNQ